MNERSYREFHKSASEFETREDYLNHELEIMQPRRWGLNLPKRDYCFEFEDFPNSSGRVLSSDPSLLMLARYP